MLLEAAGGLYAHSLALLADAAHMLTDSASLALSYAAMRAAMRPATAELSYGHHRWEVLAAFVNGLALIVLALWILASAAMRLLAGGTVDGKVVAGIALVGLAANVGAFLVLSRGESNLNVRGAIAHVVTMLRAQEEGWQSWFAEENVKPIEISYPVLWRNLTQVVGEVLAALGLDPRLAPEPVLQRQADQRSDEWVDRYRADAEKEGLPT